MNFISFTEMQEILAYLCDELPEIFFRELNLGVVLSEKLLMNPHSRPDLPLYIMGQYVRNPIGRQIFIYYGSFKAVYQYADQAVLTAKLREVLRHEFRHHIEYLAGERGLEIEDVKQINQYLGGSIL